MNALSIFTDKWLVIHASPGGGAPSLVTDALRTLAGSGQRIAPGARPAQTLSIWLDGLDIQDVVVYRAAGASDSALRDLQEALPRSVRRLWLVQPRRLTARLLGLAQQEEQFDTVRRVISRDGPSSALPLGRDFLHHAAETATTRSNRATWECAVFVANRYLPPDRNSDLEPGHLSRSLRRGVELSRTTSGAETIRYAFQLELFRRGLWIRTPSPRERGEWPSISSLLSYLPPSRFNSSRPLWHVAHDVARLTELGGTTEPALLFAIFGSRAAFTRDHAAKRYGWGPGWTHRTGQALRQVLKGTLLTLEDGSASLEIGVATVPATATAAAPSLEQIGPMGAGLVYALLFEEAEPVEIRSIRLALQKPLRLLVEAGYIEIRGEKRDLVAPARRVAIATGQDRHARDLTFEARYAGARPGRRSTHRPTA